mgnify:CR=1 FL=1
MAGSVNKVIILGNLGRDPEVRTSNDGNKIVQLNIATSERLKHVNKFIKDNYNVVFDTNGYSLVIFKD